MDSLNPARFKETEFANHSYSAVVELGTKREDMEKPGFWAHVAPLLEQYDRIAVVPDDGAWWAELLVVSCTKNYALVTVLQWHDLNPTQTNPDTVELPKEYEIQFKGKHLQYGVIRKSDGALLKSGLKRDEAALWLREHVKAMA